MSVQAASRRLVAMTHMHTLVESQRPYIKLAPRLHTLILLLSLLLLLLMMTACDIVVCIVCPYDVLNSYVHVLQGHSS